MSQQHDYLLQFFEYKHLPEHLQEISAPFHFLAHRMVALLSSNPERSAGLRKLLEAKDCFVRAKLYKSDVPLPDRPPITEATKS